MIDPQGILACVGHNEAPEEWLIVLHAQDKIREK